MFKAAKHVEVFENDSIIAMIIGINCKLYNLKDAIVFPGHIDTVPWSSEQIVELDEDNFLSGRGICDMKCFFSCALDAIDMCVDDIFSMPIVVAISFDEETNSKGVKKLFVFKKNLINVKYCIVGEPTSLNVALKSRGCYDVVMEARSENSHMSLSKSNPIEICTESIIKMKQIKNGHNMKIDVGYIHGGKTLNVVPNICRAYFTIRTMCEEDIFSVNTIIKEKGISFYVKKTN